MRGVALLLLAACGADSDPVPVDPISVHVTAGDFPVAGVRVVFQSAESRLVLDTITDDSGVALAYVPGGGYVTLLDPFTQVLEEPFVHRVYTIAGAQPGETLEVHDRAGTTLSPRMRITPPSHPLATAYQLYSSCSSEVIDINEPYQFTGCKPIEDLLIVALDGSGRIVGVEFFPDVPIVDGGRLDYSNEEYYDLDEVPFMYSNLPSGVLSVSLARWTLETRTIVPIEHKATLAMNGSVAFLGRTCTPEKRGTIFASTFYAPQTLRNQTKVTWGPEAPPANIDGADLLQDPSVEPRLVDRTLTWSFPDDADVADAVFSCGRDEAAWIWRVVAPFDREGLALPVLPNDLATYLPRTSDECPNFGVNRARVTGGYDGVRPRVMSQDDLWFVTGSSGGAIIQFIPAP